MAYDRQLADRVREYLAEFPKLEIEEAMIMAQAGRELVLNKYDNTKLAVQLQGYLMKLLG